MTQSPFLSLVVTYAATKQSYAEGVWVSFQNGSKSFSDGNLLDFLGHKVLSSLPQETRMQNGNSDKGSFQLITMKLLLETNLKSRLCPTEDAMPGGSKIRDSKSSVSNTYSIPPCRTVPPTNLPQRYLSCFSFLSFIRTSHAFHEKHL